VSDYTSSTIGTSPDDVVLSINGQQFTIYEGYEWHEGVMEQPSTWSCRTGWGGTVADFLNSYPPRSKFQLSVGGALQATGFLDSVKVSGETGGASEVVFSGRDSLAPLHDYDVAGAITFQDTTYTSLVWAVLSGIGLVTGSPTNPDPSQLQATNDANRQVKAGASVKVLQPPRTIDQILEDDAGNPTPVSTSITIMAKPGEKWMTFLRRYLDPAGLVLWAAADGTFVLSEPNVNQAPLYQITRRLVGSTAVGNVTSYSFTNDCTHRHSSCVIYGRGGGRKTGVGKTRGSQVDPEMAQLGYNQVRCHHDTHCQSQAQCENYALRKLAEERREGYQLWYTIPGHTLPLYGTPSGTSGQVAVITVDTIVQVDDEELGISAPFYVDTVIRSRNPQTSTRVRLVRPNDIILVPAPATTVAVPPMTPMGANSPTVPQPSSGESGNGFAATLGSAGNNNLGPGASTSSGSNTSGLDFIGPGAYTTGNVPGGGGAGGA
jgi:prophage tail gpP-like protein